MKKKMSVLDFKKYKEEGRKFAYVTALRHTTRPSSTKARSRSSSGDSLGMIMWGTRTLWR